MHYCLMLFTKDCPTKDCIEKLMSPYDCENNQDGNPIPQFTWDWYEIGGIYNGQIKLKVDKDSEKYNWKHIDIKGRNGTLFWSHLLSNIKRFDPFFSEEHYYKSLGFRDNFLYVDGAFVEDILNFNELNCFAFMTEDGQVYSRGWRNGRTIVNNDDFKEKLEIQKEKSKDLFITIIDCHI